MPTSSHPSECHLRILATSDLHMNVAASLDAEPGSVSSGGLARLATLIAERTQSAPGACLIVDNGDFLQGTRLSDYLADTVLSGEQHPLAQAFNAIGYSAVGLGNHEFDYGLPVLAEIAGQLSAPLLSSNINPTTPLPWIQPSTIVPVGQICVGITSGLPIGTARWSHSQLHGSAQVSDLMTALSLETDLLRRNGADLVVVLAHSGFGKTPSDLDNILGEIAARGICDILVGGHTHGIYPKTGDQPDTTTATVIPGFGGNWLGEFNVTLHKAETGPWLASSITTDLLPTRDTIPEDPNILRLFQTATKQAQKKHAQVIGTSPTPLTSYFETITPSAAMRFTAKAQMRAMEEARTGTDFQDLPLLSAVNPGKSGGIYGPHHYTDIPAGPLTAGGLYDLQEYMNELWAVAVYGHEVVDWLERSAAQFHQIQGDGLPLLLREDAPAFNSDVLFGLTYQIDLREPARYSADGAFERPHASRIKNIRHAGRPITNSDRFLVAASNFRICGGGNFPGLSPDRVALRTDASIRQVMAQYCCDETLATREPSWQFAPTNKPMRALFRTGPGALRHLSEIEHLSPGPARDAPGGFIDIPVTI